ncbi:MCE family protein [Mycobacterium sp.]|uniref:MCE family protein n=1 Tax=Mycobacterium sp. TaxID=1785 RepID=UPI003D0EC040
MTAARGLRIGLAAVQLAVLVAAVVFVVTTAPTGPRTLVTAYFENSNGIYPGDEVRVLGVPVGKIESIEPQPQRAKITFWFRKKYSVPADVKAAILSPALVTARFIQLTPVYTGGPRLRDDAVIPQERTAVPVEYDDLRVQLEKLTKTLQPTQPGGVSTLGGFINTAADNLRGQGASIRETVINLSQALSVLGDQSANVFGTLKHLAVLVSALRDSTDLMRQLNQNLAAVTALLANDPNEVGAAVADLNTAVGDVRDFLADNQDALGTTSDKAGEVLKALGDSLDDVKQALHVFPSTLQNYVNIYEPAHGSVTGYLAPANFANPISFLCGAIQAASRLNAEQSAKLCVQYLAPILKNRQYNFPPFGVNGSLFPIPFPPFALLPVGAQARPNEVTFSENWLRPDYVPPAGPAGPGSPGSAKAAPIPPATGAGPVSLAPLAAEAPPPDASAAPPPKPTDPAAGLHGMMVAPGGGS